MIRVRSLHPMPLTQPLVFDPIFMERIWGGRRLETLYQKRLPPRVPIGESWEIVDRAEAQSVVRSGSRRGKTLHELWEHDRADIFGGLAESERFPLLIKLLDAQDKLSLQVHPPAKIAKELGGEAKSEFWYLIHADPAAEIFLGLKEGRTRTQLEKAIERDEVETHVHRMAVATGDAVFLPSGRIHAIGAGNVIVEIQQNSDTTYRVFDWNRLDAKGAPRHLHLEQAFRAIDFHDHEPSLISPNGESLVRQSFFAVEKWFLQEEREAGPKGSFAIVACLTGAVACAGVDLRPGEFFLVPASLKDRALQPRAENTSLLRVTIP